MDINNNQGSSLKGSKALKWILVVGLVVVLNLFFGYAIDAFYKKPQFENFCQQKQVNIIPDTKNKCVAEGGQWTEDPSFSRSPKIPGEVVPAGYCNMYYTCQKEYEETNKVYNRNVFVALVILGVASLIGGFFLAAYEAVSLGFSLGGVVSLVIAAARYWSDMDEWLRVIVLGLALATLIYVGIKKFRIQ